MRSSSAVSKTAGITVVAALVFGANAVFSWYETMKMIAFQSHRTPKEAEKEAYITLAELHVGPRDGSRTRTPCG